MVDLMGVEPMASRMRTERSPTELQTRCQVTRTRLEDADRLRG